MVGAAVGTGARTAHESESSAVAVQPNACIPVVTEQLDRHCAAREGRRDGGRRMARLWRRGVAQKALAKSAMCVAVLLPKKHLIWGAD